jgi:hypothetical protein
MKERGKMKDKGRGREIELILQFVALSFYP